MPRARLLAMAAAAWLAATCGARAQDPSRVLWTPENVAAAIEKEAAKTSFSKLESFGRDALKLPIRERENRLYHVAWILLNQSEFDRFKRWNDLLAAQAAAAHDHRFQVVAKLNALRSRYDQGDVSASADIRKIAETEPDWFARIHAMRLAAITQIKDGQVGAALRELADAEALAPPNTPDGDAARAAIWEIKGVALVSLQDLDGSAVAFGRSQFEYGPHGYPRPDFDGLYNMASVAASNGDEKLAASLYAFHHKLAMQSELPNLRVWDRNICATVAEGRGASKDVLDCFKGLGADLGDAAFLAPRILPARAVAEARTGDLAGAERDLLATQKLRASGAFPPAVFSRLPQVEGEVARAKGDYAQAYRLLSAYADQRAIAQSQRFSAGISQITMEMEKQLGMRRDQLVTARRNVDLQRDVIRFQVLIDVIAGVVGAAVLALLGWQWRIADQLRRARRTADAANRAKSEFLANMSHEIRTPLNGVVAVADMLARSELPPKAREMAEIIRASGDTLQRLLSDILDVARIESGKITIEAAPFHVGEMVRAVAALSQLKCDEKGVRLTVSVAPEMEQVVVGDLVRVRQVVTNLLSNAAKFTEWGEVVLTVERTAAGRARFCVADTGVGFDMADKGKVLGRFQQADSSITRRFGGTGLGLSICCELATLMGGVLDCSSVEGVGSRFWLELPLELTPEVEAPALEDASSLMSDQVLRILLADDHPTNRKVVELMLEGGIADLTGVENGVQAVEAFRTQAFDLILMDMQMPVMDGLTAIRAIRRLEAERGLAPTPVVMLTANALPEHVAAAAAAGADLHLAKPFTASALFDVIAAALPGAEADEAADTELAA